jgi:DDE family transposase
MSDQEILRSKYERLRPFMDERLRRLWAASEAQALGRGGISRVAAATGISRRTLAAGLRELQTGEPGSPAPLPRGRIRRTGGGRKPLTEIDPTLVQDLEALVEPTSRGDPQSPLRWTCKSTAKLAAQLQRQGHQIGPRKVAELLHQLKYSLQGNRKTKEGTSHPDRDGQFRHINEQARSFQERGQPVVSVDAKKRELVGDFRNGGQEWQPKGSPEEVRVHDFEDKGLGHAIPYGVYDLTANQGWVSVGTDHNTAAFAVETLRRWWHQMGALVYPEASELLVTADGGGSNAHQSRLWKVGLQQLADETGLRITVCHFPPGTSKWNKIEHRMFAWITQNWRGRPLISHETIVNLIANTTTEKGLQIRAELDPNSYPTGLKVPNEEMARVQIERASFHGDWNYTIVPRVSPH